MDYWTLLALLAMLLLALFWQVSVPITTTTTEDEGSDEDEEPWRVSLRD